MIALCVRRGPASAALRGVKCRGCLEIWGSQHNIERHRDGSLGSRSPVPKESAERSMIPGRFRLRYGHFNIRGGTSRRTRRAGRSSTEPRPLEKPISEIKLVCIDIWHERRRPARSLWPRRLRERHPSDAAVRYTRLTSKLKASLLVQLILIPYIGAHCLRVPGASLAVEFLCKVLRTCLLPRSVSIGLWRRG